MTVIRFFQIAIYSIVFMIVGSLIYGALFESGGERGAGFGYGNLWVQYSVQERGILNPKIEWLIATPVMPKNQTFKGDDDQWTYFYENGKVFSFTSNSKNLIWVDPESGPKKVSADLTEDLIQRIDQTREGAKGKSFKSGMDFLDWVRSTKPEVVASNGP